MQHLLYPQTYLRSRSRALDSDIFGSSEDSVMDYEEINEDSRAVAGMEHWWTVSGSFSSSGDYPQSYGSGSNSNINHDAINEDSHAVDEMEHLWAASDSISSSGDYLQTYGSGNSNFYDTDADIGIGIGANQQHQQQHQQQQQQQSGNSFQDNIFVTSILPLIVFFLFVCGCCKGRCGGQGPPGPEFHNGHLIRARAQRIWDAQRRRSDRHKVAPVDRLALVRSGMCAHRVQKQDPATGNLVLSVVETPIGLSSEARVAEPTEPIVTPGIETRKSFDTVDTLPVEPGSESDSNDDDEHDVCPVCLEGFGTGDVVMFARQNTNSSLSSSCNHVFHKECLLPWLLERRENECPSCRAVFVSDDNHDCVVGDPNEIETDARRNSNAGNDQSAETGCIVCEVPDSGASSECFVDCEAARDDRRVAAATTTTTAGTTRYWIVKGRIATMPSKASRQIEANAKIEIETFPTPKAAIAAKESSDEFGSPVVRSRRLLQGQRAVSMARLGDTLRLGANDDKSNEHEHDHENDLSVPLRLQRVSKSFPIQQMLRPWTATQLETETTGSRDGERSTGSVDSTAAAATTTPIFLDDRPNGYGTELYESSSCDDDDSDEDDAIRRMVQNHHNSSRSGDKTLNTIIATKNPLNASSIFPRSHS